MDTTANRRRNAPNAEVLVSRAAASVGSRLKPSEAQSLSADEGPTSVIAAVARVARVAFIALVVAGCETVPPTKPTATVAPPSRIEATTPQQPVIAPKHQTSTTRPVTVAVQQAKSPQSPTRIASKPALVQAGGKTVEKPLVSHPTAVTSVSNRPLVKPEPAEATPQVARASDSGTSAPAAELIIKGPPHPERPKSGGKKAVALAGLGFGGAVVALMVTLSIVRRPQVTKAPEGKKLDPLRADGILTKEPLNDS